MTEARRTPTTKRLVALTIPVFLHGSVVALLFATERWFARPMGVDVLAGLSIGTVIAWVLTTIFSGIGITAGLTIGERLASAETHAASRALKAAVVLAGIVGAALSLLYVAAGPSFVQFAFGQSQASSLACAYLAVAVPMIFLAFVESALAQSFFGAGDPKTPLLGSALSGVTTLGFLLIARAVGGSIALFAAASLAGALVSAGFMLTRIGKLGLESPLKGDLRARDLTLLLERAAPTLSEKASGALGYFVFASMLGRLGSDALAANQALLSIGSVACLVPEALGVAASALIVQARATRAWRDISSIARQTMLLGAVGLALFGAFVVALRGPLVGVFLADRAASELAIQSALVFAVMQPFMAIATVLRATLRAEERARTAFSITTVGTFAVRLPLTFVLIHWFDAGLVGVWIAVLLDWVTQVVLGVGAVFVGRSALERLTPSKRASIRHGWQTLIVASLTFRR